MVELRDYQREAVDTLMEALQPPAVAPDRMPRVMYQLPTGGGKTAVGGELVSEYLAANNGARAVWLTHRIELVRQSGMRLVEAHGVNPTRLSVMSPVVVNNRLKGRGGWLKPTGRDLLICDEAHHTPAKSWSDVLRAWPGVALGLTATPWRMAKKEGFDHIWDRLICGPTTAELTERGYLAPARVVTTPSSMRHVLGRGFAGGDYSTRATWDDEENRVALLGGGLDWAEDYEWSRILVYALSVQHATEFAELALERGYKSGLILGRPKGKGSEVAADYDRQRARTMQAFRDGAVDMLINCEVLTEGVDVPEADAALILRPTRSLALWLQMCGRVLRPAEGKPYGLILDATDNHRRLDLPDSPREWSLAPRERDPKSGDAILKTCLPSPVADGCETLNYAATHNCSNCAAPFGKPCSTCGKFRFWRDWQRESERCDQCVSGEEASEEERRVGKDGRTLRDLFEVGHTSRNGNQVAISAGFRWWMDVDTGRCGAFLLQPRDRHIRAQIAEYGLGTMASGLYIEGVRKLARRSGYPMSGNDREKLVLGSQTLAAAERAHRLIDAGIRRRAAEVGEKYR